MIRRDFISLLGGTALAWPFAARTQSSAKRWRIGMLEYSRPDVERVRFWGVFRQRLGELGYVEGDNITFEPRWADGMADRLPTLAAELAKLKVDVIATGGAPSAEAAKRATNTIPIVMATGSDPVALGLVSSLSRPGGNVTGVATLVSELAPKRLQLLREMIPQMSRVATLVDPVAWGSTLSERETERAAPAFGMSLRVMTARGPEEFDNAFKSMLQAHVAALIIQPSAMFFGERIRLSDLAMKHGIPTIVSERAYAEAGCLDMDRRVFLMSSLIVLTTPRAGNAQQTGLPYRIGFLGSVNASSWASQIAALRQGLREHGYEEGKNIVIEYRWAEEDLDRLPKLASELVSLKVDLIVTHGTPGSRAAKQATTTIPVVMAAVGDPVRSGLVRSLARPGGNLTGNSILEADLALKRLQLVKEVASNASRVGLLYAPGGTQSGAAAVITARAVDDAAGSLGMQVHSFSIREANDVASALAIMAKEGTKAVIVGLDATLAPHYGEIARLAIQYRLATVGGAKQFVEAGGLFAYGANVEEAYRHAAGYVDKILRGAKPADLPIEQPTTYLFAINLKTAKELGLTIPQSLLLRADEVIQ